MVECVFTSKMRQRLLQTWLWEGMASDRLAPHTVPSLTSIDDAQVVRQHLFPDHTIKFTGDIPSIDFSLCKVFN